MKTSTIDYLSSGLKEFSMVGQLHNLAVSLAKKGDFPNNLASAMLHVNVSEYVTSFLITVLGADLRLALSKSPMKNVGIRSLKFGNQNRDKIEALKTFKFFSDDLYTTTFEEIKSARDRVFHNLVDASSKKIKISSDIKLIQNKSIELIKIFYSILNLPKDGITP